MSGASNQHNNPSRLLNSESLEGIMHLPRRWGRGEASSYENPLRATTLFTLLAMLDAFGVGTAEKKFVEYHASETEPAIFISSSHPSSED